MRVTSRPALVSMPPTTQPMAPAPMMPIFCSMPVSVAPAAPGRQRTAGAYHDTVRGPGPGRERSGPRIDSADTPRRSVLFMPASNARALDKAASLPADTLIFDLEDAVAPDAKEAARAMACAGARSGGYGRREIVIRVNALTTSWGEADLAAVAGSGAHAVLLPKVEDAGDVHEALRALAAGSAPESL